MPAEKPARLAPSELGTKEYWDSLYATELANHASNPADTGTVWFDDADAEAKMVEYLVGAGDSDDDDDDDDKDDSDADADAHADADKTKNHAAALHLGSVLDLGCGNGSLLRALQSALRRRRLKQRPRPALAQPRHRMLGVDYSEASIQLARTITAAKAHGEDEGEDDDDDDDDDEECEMEFAVWNILQDRVADLESRSGNGNDCGSRQSNSAGWDLVLDKGTFDAISLGSRQPGDDGGSEDGRNERQTTATTTTTTTTIPRPSTATKTVETAYRAQVLRLLRPGGRFLITSCNWTEAELCAWMEGSDDDDNNDNNNSGHDGHNNSRLGRLEKVGRVAYPSFRFGGVQGQAVCTVCFAKSVGTS